MKNPLTLLSGLGLGAALMYFYDPERGARRRSLFRDQLVSTMNDAGNAFEPAAEDAANRTRGMLYEARAELTEQDVSDRVLNRRVRAEMGRWVAHPGSIAVNAHNGTVSLHGPVLEHELDGLLKAVKSVRGVESVDNQLSVHKVPGDVPGLQGGDVPAAYAEDLWSPATRMAVGLAGSALTGAGFKEGGLVGSFFSAVGLASLGRAISGTPAKRLLGVDGGHRAVDVTKTVNVNAPIDEVYQFWSNFENFPRFMSYVKEVKDLGDGRSHWVVEGPAGTSVSWDAHVTQRVENKRLAWASGESTPVQNAGIVHFSPNQDGGTQVQVELSYNPPAGVLGHTVAEILGYDPRSLMNEDLLRFKSLIEEGKTSANGHQVTRREVTHG